VQELANSAISKDYDAFIISCSFVVLFACVGSVFVLLMVCGGRRSNQRLTDSAVVQQEPAAPGSTRQKLIMRQGESATSVFTFNQLAIKAFDLRCAVCKSCKCIANRSVNQALSLSLLGLGQKAINQSHLLERQLPVITSAVT